MRNRLTRIALVSTAALAASAAWAQAPVVVEPDQHYDGKLSTADPRLADGAPHACYAINTKAGDQIALTLHADKFPARMQVGRGPSCAMAAFQFDKTGAVGKDAQVGFKAAGGRYVIAVRGATPEAAGAFRLNVEATLSVAGQPAPATAPGAQSSAEPPSARKLAMLAQVDKRNAEIAAEQERQRKAAEEQRLADERLREQTRRLEEAVANMQAQQRAEAAAAEAEEASQPRVNPLAAFNNAFNQAMAENAAQRADQQRFLDNLAAQQRAANAAREARERAEQARQDAARREAARAEAERQQALSRQLAEANAYRNAQMANADAATRQRLEQQNRAAQQAAQSVGGGQAFQQRQAELDSAASAQRAAEAQAQERQRRAEQQRAAEQQRVAEQQKLAEAQRRQQQQAQAQATPSASASNPGAIIIAQRPSAPPVPPVASPQPNKTPIPTASSSNLTCPAGRRRSTPEELMVEFKYGKTRAEAEAELNKKQGGLYNMQCAGNDFGWQCKANYKSGRMIEFCVGGPGQ